MKAPTHYHQLAAACRPHLQHYHRDLLMHDRRVIRRHPALPFLHVTRDSGTHIQFMREGDDPTWPAPGESLPYLFATATREHLVKEAETFIAYFIASHREENVIVHHFDGRALHLIGYAKGDSILRDWAARVRREWAKPYHPPSPPVPALTLCFH